MKTITKDINNARLIHLCYEMLFDNTVFQFYCVGIRFQVFKRTCVHFHLHFKMFCLNRLP